MSATSSERATELVTSAVEVDDDLVATLIGRGGYTHPLFNPTPEQATEHGGPPLPGQAVLLLMGGLVEQSGALDHAIAMLEIRRVTFRAMLRAGSRLRVRLALGEATTTGSGKTLQLLQWTGIDEDDAVVAEAEVLMLVHPLNP